MVFISLVGCDTDHLPGYLFSFAYGNDLLKERSSGRLSLDFVNGHTLQQ